MRAESPSIASHNQHVPDLFQRHPNNPLLRERLIEIDGLEAQRGSGAREKPREKGAYDLNASLDALESLDYGELEPAEGHAGEGEQVDVEEVFAKFKAGVRAQVSETDSATHYDLGLAYREMDLIQDAVDEFLLAARDPKRECVCQHMIGMILGIKGPLQADAADALAIAIAHAHTRSSIERVGIPRTAWRRRR